MTLIKNYLIFLIEKNQFYRVVQIFAEISKMEKDILELLDRVGLKWEILRSWEEENYYHPRRQ